MVDLLKTSADTYIDFAIERVKHTLSEELESFKAVIGTQEAANHLRFNKLFSFRVEQLSEFY